MTRVSAANGGAYPVGRAEIMRVETAFRFAEARARQPSEALRRGRARAPGAGVRRWLISPAVFICAAIAVFAVFALTLQHLRLERDLALSAGARAVDRARDAARPPAQRGAERRSAGVPSRSFSQRS